MSDYGVTVNYIRQERLRDPEFSGHGHIPFSGLHVKTVPAVSHAHILTHLPRKSVGYVAVTLEDLVYL